MKILEKVYIKAKTKKAILVVASKVKLWIPNSAIVEIKNIDASLRSIVVESWFESPLFHDISLLELLNEKEAPKVNYTTQIKEVDFPKDLMKIQQEAVQFGVKLNRALIWLWTGCGKTKIGIDIANVIHLHKGAKRLYWITPNKARVLSQLNLSFERWLNKDIEVFVRSLNWFSTNIDSDITENDVVVIDEVHRVKNGIIIRNNPPKCALSNNIRKSLIGVGYVYGLTATSCLNGILDLFGIFYCMNKSIVIDEGRKAQHYLKIKASEATGVKSMSEFISKVSPYIFHKNKLEYDSRQCIQENYSLRLNQAETNALTALYNRSRGAFLKKESIVDVVHRMMNCTYRAGGKKYKMECLSKILLNLKRDEQAIVFGFTVNGKFSDISLIRECCRHNNESFTELHGLRSEDESNLAIARFRKGEIKILIASYGCGSEILDFPNASHVILFGHSLNPIHRFQGIGRIDRIIQKKQIYVHNIFIENSVEGFINSLYNKKVDLTKDLSSYMNNEEQIINNKKNVDTKRSA